MRNPDLPSDLAGLASAAQRSLEAGDFAATSAIIEECLAAFQSKTRNVDDARAYRDWLKVSLNLAHISRKHLSHQVIKLQRLNYGRLGPEPRWSVQG